MNCNCWTWSMNYSWPVIELFYPIFDGVIDEKKVIGNNGDLISYPPLNNFSHSFTCGVFKGFKYKLISTGVQLLKKIKYP